MTWTSSLNSVLTKLIMPALSGEQGSNAVREALASGEPKMIARLGTTELRAICFCHLPMVARFGSLENKVYTNMVQLSGFFPASRKDLVAFSNMMIGDLEQVDILGSYRIEELFIRSCFSSKIKRVALNCLEPYMAESPWSELLSDLNVLVVHPFSELIERQYSERRESLFASKKVLPQFKSLQTIQAVQSIAGNLSGYDNWFAALEAMKGAISSKRYDVAIVGCGAYGFPLAAHIKREGKRVVHMGGATQILFGIKGSRWDNHPQISRLYNKAWVRPGKHFTPSGSMRVEGGCYW